MYMLDLEDGSIEHLENQEEYWDNNRTEFGNRPERIVSKIFERTTDYKVGRADSKSSYIGLDDRAKAAFKSDFGVSLFNLDFKGMPDQFHYKIENGEVVDYYFAEIKASTSLRKSQLEWMKNYSEFPIKVIFTR